MNSKLFCLVGCLLLLSTSLESSKFEEKFRRNLGSSPLDLSDYPYPRPEPANSRYLRIAVVGTNDIHGHILPTGSLSMDSNEPYEFGGILYFSSYLKILRNEWGNKLIWLEAGDEYQGTLESNENVGEAFVKSLNYQKLGNSLAATIGNHEFDFGIQNLTKMINMANFTYINSNIKSKATGRREAFEKTRPHKIITIDGIKIGVFSLTTQETPTSTSTNVSHLIFDDLVDVTLKKAKELRTAGAEIVLLTCHVGDVCTQGDVNDLYTNTIRYESTKQKSECLSTYELSKLLSKIPAGYLDGVISGHTHSISHHWQNNIPFIQAASYNNYFNILYLKFDKVTRTLVKEETAIEGPVPVCDKVFSSLRRCDFENGDTRVQGGLTNFLFHGEQVSIDQDLYNYLLPYMTKAELYKKDIYSFVDAPMNGSRTTETVLGNFVADFFRIYTQSDVAIINNGMIRVNWAKGNLSFYRIFETFPFLTYIMTIEMTGQELLRTIQTIQVGNFYYSQSGLIQRMKASPKQVVSVTMSDGTAIDEAKTYRVAAPDFLVNGGDDWKKVREFYTPKNPKNLGLVRDNIKEYLKGIKTINKGGELALTDSNRRLIFV